MASKGATPRGVLSAKHLRFVGEYLIDLNAKQAAIRTGYTIRSAEVTGHRLLRNSKVQQAIEVKRKELAGKLDISRERILREMARIGFSDLRKLFDEDGHLKAVKDLDDDTAAAIASIEVDTVTVYPKDGGSKTITLTTKVKTWDKGKQLENLQRHLGDAGDKPTGPAIAVTVPGLDEVQAKLDAILKGRGADAE